MLFWETNDLSSDRVLQYILKMFFFEFLKLGLLGLGPFSFWNGCGLLLGAGEERLAWFVNGGEVGLIAVVNFFSFFKKCPIFPLLGCIL